MVTKTKNEVEVTNEILIESFRNVVSELNAEEISNVRLKRTTAGGADHIQINYSMKSKGHKNDVFEIKSGDVLQVEFE